MVVMEAKKTSKEPEIMKSILKSQVLSARLEFKENRVGRRDDLTCSKTTIFVRASLVVKTCRLTSLCGVNDNRRYHKRTKTCTAAALFALRLVKNIGFLS